MRLDRRAIQLHIIARPPTPPAPARSVPDKDAQDVAKILVTGAAGFIGSHVAHVLLDRGDAVLGLDDLNAYYDPTLKAARLERLTIRPGFDFVRQDVADIDAWTRLTADHPDLEGIVHLAAQAGVRYSLVDPYAYVRSNLLGQVALLEACKRLDGLRHVVYASSSSIYGANEQRPFSIDHVTDRPLSLYGATKKADELIGHAYAHLFRIPLTGLRFFTVYGPWGRPDMAAWLFADAILDGRPIRLFNNGDLERDFTFVDDIVAGVIAALDRPPAGDDAAAPARVYNLGNHRPEHLRRFVEIIEQACGKKAIIEPAPMQPGDVKATYADIDASTRDLGFVPTTPIDIGLPRFVDWFKAWRAR